MKIFEKRKHKYYTEQRIFGVNFRFLNKKGFELLENMPGLLENVKYQVLSPKAKDVYKIPKIEDVEKTIHRLQKSDLSIARFGDGEFRCMEGKPIPFQQPNEKLVQRLKEILKNNNKKLLVGVPRQFGINKDDFWNNFLAQKRDWLYQYIDFDKDYIDTWVSRFYGCVPENAQMAEKLFDEFKKVWKNKDIIFVEGEESRLGYGNDLFSNAKSIKRILCPKTNAFDVYDKILTACRKQPKNSLFLLALGPTATVLADDLSKDGYRALDLGHLDIEYEWMRMKADHICPVPSKYTNEAKGGKNVKDVQDPTYLSEIIEKISLE